jgi:hypothetical protein
VARRRECDQYGGLPGDVRQLTVQTIVRETIGLLQAFADGRSGGAQGLV